MVKRKRSRKNVKRRRKRFKKRRYRLPVLIAPSSKLVRLRYAANVSVDPSESVGVSLSAAHSFRANGVRDPDYTGVGHQPRGYDQLMALYKYSRVVSSKIRADCYSPATTYGASYCYVGIRQTGADYQTVTDTYSFLEKDDTKYKKLYYDRRNQIVTAFYSHKKVMGNSVRDNQSVVETTGTNVATPQYFHVFAAAADNTTDITAINMNVIIDYIVLLTDRIDPSVS